MVRSAAKPRVSNHGARIPRRNALADSPRHPKHENQHFGDRLVELRRDLVADLDLGQRPRQHLVLLDRDVMGLGEFDDLGADLALALGGDRGAPVLS